MKNSERETGELIPPLKSGTQLDHLLEETLATLNSVDECNQLLIKSMRSLRYNDMDEVKAICGCAKEVRELLRLKIDAAKLLKGSLD